MKASIALLSLCVPLCSFAQNADSSAQSLSSSSAVGAQQNQSITIVNPVAAADSRSVSSIESRSTSSSDQNITTSGTTTQNLNSTVSGTSRNIVEYSGTYT
ncbi:hypothetical protein AAIL67_21720, partial [Comamonas sp. A7-5]